MSPALVTIVSAAALAAAGIAVVSQRPASPATPPGLVLDALGPQTYTPYSARAAMTTRGAGIPLPAGGNFNGIRWELLQGEIPAQRVDAVMQYNAACQWLRAWRRGSGNALRVLRGAASWTALRGSPIAAVAAQASRGKGDDLETMLAQCDASHTREVAYAKQLGLTPST